MKIVATYNIKGGVGKTAAAVNLAYLAAEEGYRTLLWDLDPQGAASFYFRIRPRVKGGARALVGRKRELADMVKGSDYDNLDLVPADFSYRDLDIEFHEAKKPAKQLVRLLHPLSDEYDLLLLDSAPSISLVSENIFRAADALLVPIIPTTLSVRTFRQLQVHLEGDADAHCALIPFFSMVERRRRLHGELMDVLRREHAGWLASEVPYAAQVETMGVHRAPLVAFAPHAPAALAFKALWNELRDRLGMTAAPVSAAVA